jgi:hypothetical protein
LSARANPENPAEDLGASCVRKATVSNDSLRAFARPVEMFRFMLLFIDISVICTVWAGNSDIVTSWPEPDGLVFLTTTAA